MSGRPAATPQAPDYAGLANQQAAIDRQAADRNTRVNRVNQSNPYGTSTWSEGPNGQWSQSTQFSGPEQTIHSGLQNVRSMTLDQASTNTRNPFSTQGMTGWGQAPTAPAARQMVNTEGMQSNQTGTAGYQPWGSLNTHGMSGFGNLNTQGMRGWGSASMNGSPDLRGNLGLDDLGAMPDPEFSSVEQVRDAMMGQLQPGLDRRRESEEAKMAAMGITRGSRAFGSNQQDLAFGENDAAQKALLSGVGAANDLYSRRMGNRRQGFQEQSADASFQNNARNQFMNEQLNLGDFADRQRGQQFGERSAMANFDNDVRSQQFGERSAMADFDNSTRQAQTNENLDVAGFNNDLRQQQLNERMGVTNQWNNMVSDNFNDQMDIAGYNDAQRGLQYSEALRTRQLPMQEMAMYNQFQQPLGFDGYASGSSAQGADMFGAAERQYSAALDSANARNAARSNLQSGLFGLAGTVAGSALGPGGAAVGGEVGRRAGGRR